MRHLFKAAFAACVCTILAANAAAGSQPAHLAELQPTDPPEGARHLCRTLSWACETGSGASAPDDAALLALAREVNVAVNRRIEPAHDSSIYGVAERWTLPQGGRGDCEDYALLKMRKLIDRGVPRDRLLLSLVVNDSFVPHVVLVLRTGEADYFLDNLTDLVAPWHRAGYAVLTMQSPADKSRWSAVFMGEELAWNSGDDADLPWNRDSQVAEETNSRRDGGDIPPALGAGRRDY